MNTFLKIKLKDKPYLSFYYNKKLNIIEKILKSLKNFKKQLIKFYIILLIPSLNSRNL